ncbi:MAG TPA: ABC transporter substrate-binding protein [Stellaceae bacterium]|nr:ABC transporter substrate-binding protein [Stellaceae bacterium]
MIEARGIAKHTAARLVGATLLVSVLSVAAQADDKTIRIGVMNDMSGPYADFQGPGSVLAAQMAVEDFGGKAAGRKVEVISADHQNKTDVGAAIARKWIDQDGVDMIADLPNSAVALAVNQIVKDKNKVLIASGAGTAELTGAQCTPNTVAWTYDTWELGHALGHAIVGQGKKKWFFITADYAFGHDLQKQASAAVTQSGGTVLGSVDAPLGTADFSSFLLQAQGSKADVLALANAGADLTNAVKQSNEFGIKGQMALAGFVLTVQNIPALTLNAAQGLLTVNSWYWDQSDGTRKFAHRYAERFAKHDMPNDMQAGMYSSVLAYLRAVDKLGSAADGKAVVAAMKATPSNDSVYGNVTIREDGRAMHPVYLLQVKKPDASKGVGDYFSVVATIPAEQAFRPIADGHCPLVAAK